MRMRMWAPLPSFLSYMGPAVSSKGEETSGPGTGKTAEGKTKRTMMESKKSKCISHSVLCSKKTVQKVYHTKDNNYNYKV